MSGQPLQAEVPSSAAIPQSAPISEPRLRLWPGVALVIVIWAARVWASTGTGSPTKFFFGLVIIPMLALLLMHLWWLFGSRLRWKDGLIVFGTFVATTIATALISGSNFPAMALILYGVPVVASAWIGWLFLSQTLPWSVRRSGLLLVLVLTGGLFTLVRVEGMDGNFNAKFSWRWIPTAEDQLLAELKTTPVAAAAPDSKTGKVTELKLQAGDWPEFRGVQRDSRLTGVRIQTDWAKHPPRELWRHRIGPGWSSFAVIGDRIFTQEQRGEDEFVVCYHSQTGTEIWSHHDATRFYEVIAGAGPRSTPTFHEGKIYALGANGRLNCLDAATGAPVWTRDIVADSNAKIPIWGFSSSPLVAHGLVTVFAGGPAGKSVLAYKADSGDLAWTGAEGELSYCSTQLNQIGGVDQLLIITEVGMFGLRPDTGETLWQHHWPSEGIARVVQPALIGQNDFLIGTGMGMGTRRISVKHSADKWEATEGWTTRGFKPYYNDFVISGEYLYGFDGPIFMCVSLEDGSTKWRARGYGNGQVLLLDDQKVLLVLTETGEVALIEAQSEKHLEISRFKAIEGKTWNHPVIAHGKLFVRNAEEVACFELTAIPDTAKADKSATEIQADKE